MTGIPHQQKVASSMTCLRWELTHSLCWWWRFFHKHIEDLLSFWEGDVSLLHKLFAWTYLDICSQCIYFFTYILKTVFKMNNRYCIFSNFFFFFAGFIFVRLTLKWRLINHKITMSNTMLNCCLLQLLSIILITFCSVQLRIYSSMSKGIC